MFVDVDHIKRYRFLHVTLVGQNSASVGSNLLTAKGD